MAKEHFASNLKAIRKVRMQTQQEFSTWLGINHSVLNSYESKRNVPPVEVLFSIAEKANLSPISIWQENLLEKFTELELARNMLKTA